MRYRINLHVTMLMNFNSITYSCLIKQFGKEIHGIEFVGNNYSQMEPLCPFFAARRVVLSTYEKRTL